MYHDKNPKLLFLQRLREKDPSAFVRKGWWWWWCLLVVVVVVVDIFCVINRNRFIGFQLADSGLPLPLLPAARGPPSISESVPWGRTRPASNKPYQETLSFTPASDVPNPDRLLDPC
jgi:hypothetical protein